MYGRLVVLRLPDILPVLLGRGVRRCEGGSKGERQAAAPSAGVGAGLARRTACLRPAGWPIGMLDLCELDIAGRRQLTYSKHPLNITP